MPDDSEGQISRVITCATIRWKPIPGGPASVEELMPVLQDRLRQLMSEHADISEFYLDPMAWMQLDPKKITG